MKKILAFLLVLTMCLGLMAACTNTGNTETKASEETKESTAPSTEPDKTAATKEALGVAAKYVEALYKAEPEKTVSTFKLLKSSSGNGIVFPITWEVKIVDGSEEAVHMGEINGNYYEVIVNEENTVETKYQIVGTLTAEDGQTATVSFDRMVPAAVEDPIEILKAAYALEVGKAMDSESKLTGLVTSVNTAYDAGYANITVTIVCGGHEDMPIMCYRLQGAEKDPSKTEVNAAELKAGDTITVIGTIKNYNGTIEFDAGCVLLDLKVGDPIETPTLSVEEIFAEAAKLGDKESMSHPVTLTGKVTEIETEYSEQYGNVSVVLDVEGHTILCYRMKAASADAVAVGDTITVTGTIKNWAGTIEFDSGCTFTK